MLSRLKGLPELSIFTEVRVQSAKREAERHQGKDFPFKFKECILLRRAQYEAPQMCRKRSTDVKLIAKQMREQGVPAAVNRKTSLVYRAAT